MTLVLSSPFNFAFFLNNTTRYGVLRRPQSIGLSSISYTHFSSLVVASLNMSSVPGGFSDTALTAEMHNEEFKTEPAQIETDQDDGSLKEDKTMGSVDISGEGESKEAQVKAVSLSLLSPGRAEHVVPVPFVLNDKGTLFIIKEGTRVRHKFIFFVFNNTVSGLTYTNTVWKAGIRVDDRKVKLGTYSPQQEPYSYLFEEEAIPSGIFARGSYSARTKFVDDDGNCYLDESYRFEIQKHWAC